MNWHALSRAIFVMACLVPLPGCGAPVYWGIEEARAAGFDHPLKGIIRPVAAQGQTEVRPSGGSASSGIMELTPVPRPKGGDDVVGVRLEHDGTMAARRVTFGQIFIPGQVAAGQTVVAHLNGKAIPTQVDVKTSNPDGSARMAVVTVLSSAPADLMLVRAPKDTGAAPVDLAKAAADLDLSVETTIREPAGTGTRQFALGRLLADALRQGRASYWLKGPLATEARVEVPVASSMRLTADIRAYSDGSVMADVQFNNDIAMRPVGGKLTYDVTIRESGRPVLQQAGIEHFQYQTWHQQVWTKGDPAVNVVHDVRAMARAGAIHNYDFDAGVARGLVAGQLSQMSGAGFGILGNAGVAKSMGMTGGRPDIGPVTLANTLWLMTQHADAARYALAQADAAGSIPWHFIDAETGTYISVVKYPKLWSDQRGAQWDNKPLTQQIDPKNGWQPDNAHQPDLSYIPYILTGLRYRLDQLQAQASGSIVMIWPFARRDGLGIVASSLAQVRARGWALRGVNEAAFVCPDGAALCPYFASTVRNNIDYLLDEAHRSHKGEAWGWFRYDDAGRAEEGGVTSPWMQDFVASTLILMTQQGVPGAREVVVWQSNFLVGRFLAEDKGFHPRNATAYRFDVYGKTQDEPYLTWREIEADTIAHGFAKDGSVWSNNDYAYARAAHGVLAGIVSATSSPDAEKALAWMRANAPHVGREDQQKSPTFNFVPLHPADRR